ncbi:uncharacterized protein LOC135923815 isoform X2 [Gordionus sp. m RMFG-2023]|uniref:uncharacterized protein LOC135923815 isoform X2 n=1 Tax=Gordionus sp. m RMFG-2023 TaxID=3053472 RepID=UPI0031FDD3E8
MDFIVTNIDEKDDSGKTSSLLGILADIATERLENENGKKINITQLIQDKIVRTNDKSVNLQDYEDLENKLKNHLLQHLFGIEANKLTIAKKMLQVLSSDMSPSNSNEQAQSNYEYEKLYLKEVNTENQLCQTNINSNLDNIVIPKLTDHPFDENNKIGTSPIITPNTSPLKNSQFFIEPFSSLTSSSTLNIKECEKSLNLGAHCLDVIPNIYDRFSPSGNTYISASTSKNILSINTSNYMTLDLTQNCQNTLKSTQSQKQCLINKNDFCWVDRPSNVEGKFSSKNSFIHIDPGRKPRLNMGFKSPIHQYLDLKTSENCDISHSAQLNVGKIVPHFDGENSSDLHQNMMAGFESQKINKDSLKLKPHEKGPIIKYSPLKNVQIDKSLTYFSANTNFRDKGATHDHNYHYSDICSNKNFNINKSNDNLSSEKFVPSPKSNLNMVENNLSNIQNEDESMTNLDPVTNIPNGIALCPKCPIFSTFRGLYLSRCLELRRGGDISQSASKNRVSLWLKDCINQDTDSIKCFTNTNLTNHKANSTERDIALKCINKIKSSSTSSKRRNAENGYLPSDQPETSKNADLQTDISLLQNHETPKKDDVVVGNNKNNKKKKIWVCSLCPHKVYTASASLLSHYRSHAGIKPYECKQCGSRFTRRHSLDYHALIHKNACVFSCPTCHRGFRHPSHFKEHLRKHTGETPFTCAQCGMSFKTRNTFKRHLKARHYLLLSAQGIRNMTPQEILDMENKTLK